MTKKELQNILEEGWVARREKLQKRKKLGNKLTKEWKKREKNNLNIGPRRPNYLGPSNAPPRTL
jgi:hypothetical protein